MVVYKMAERTLDAATALKAFRAGGWQTKEIGTFCKWKDGRFGSRYQAKVTAYEITTTDGRVAYVMVDTLDKIMNPLEPDKATVMGWIKDHDYKPEKDWYIEDGGMTEEMWAAWNNAEDI